jgi:hypothetical protein
MQVISIRMWHSNQKNLNSKPQAVGYKLQDFTCSLKLEAQKSIKWKNKEIVLVVVKKP